MFDANTDMFAGESSTQSATLSYIFICNQLNMNVQKNGDRNEPAEKG